MKFVKLVLVPLLVLCSVLFSACKKDKDTGEGNITYPPTLLTKVRYYSKLSDSASVPKYNDSLIYNEKEQLVKVVVATGSGGWEDTPSIDTFTYNSDGLLASVIIQTPQGAPLFQYFMKYAEGRLDSVDIICSGRVSGESRNGFKLKYDTKGKFIGANTVLENELLGTQFFYRFDYTRNQSGVIDSIDMRNGYTEDLKFYRRVIYPSANNSPTNAVFDSLPAGYRFLLAQREELHFIDAPNTGGFFTYNFFSPGDNIFNNGYYRRIFAPNDPYNDIIDYTYVPTLNADGTLKAYEFQEKVRGGCCVDERYALIFSYTAK